MFRDLEDSFEKFDREIQNSIIFRQLRTKQNINSYDMMRGKFSKNYIPIDKFFLYGKRLVVELPVSFKIIDFLMEKISGSWGKYIKSEFEFRNFFDLSNDMQIEESRWSIQRGIKELTQKNIIVIIKNEKTYKVRINFFPDTWNVKEKWKILIQNKIESDIFK